MKRCSLPIYLLLLATACIPKPADTGGDTAPTEADTDTDTDTDTDADTDTDTDTDTGGGDALCEGTVVFEESFESLSHGSGVAGTGSWTCSASTSCTSTASNAWASDGSLSMYIPPTESGGPGVALPELKDSFCFSMDFTEAGNHDPGNLLFLFMDGAQARMVGRADGCGADYYYLMDEGSGCIDTISTRTGGAHTLDIQVDYSGSGSIEVCIDGACATESPLSLVFDSFLFNVDWTDDVYVDNIRIVQ